MSLQSTSFNIKLPRISFRWNYIRHQLAAGFLTVKGTEIEMTDSNDMSFSREGIFGKLKWKVRIEPGMISVVIPWEELSEYTVQFAIEVTDKIREWIFRSGAGDWGLIYSQWMLLKIKEEEERRKRAKTA